MNNNTFIRDLVLQSIQGDVNAFQELYQATRQKAYFVALSITKHEHDAQDILQDSYLKAYQNLATLKQPEQFTAWLNRIVANQAKNYISRVKPDSFADYEDDNAIHWLEETDAAFLPDENLDQAEAKALIAKLVNELPEDQRLVLLLHYFNGMEITELSAALNIPEGTVKSRLSRARTKLAAMLRQAQNKGIQFYALAPIPLLVYFIRLLGMEEGSDRLAPLVGLTAAATAAVTASTAAAGTAASSATGTAASAGKSTFAGSMLVKGLAIAATAAVTIGGAATAGVLLRRSMNPPPQTYETTAFSADTTAYTHGEDDISFTLPSDPEAVVTTVSLQAQASVPQSTTPSTSRSTTRSTTATSASSSSSWSQTTVTSTTPATAVAAAAQTVTIAPTTQAPTTAATTRYVYTTAQQPATRATTTTTRRKTTKRTTTTTTTSTSTTQTTTESTTSVPLPEQLYQFDTDSQLFIKYLGSESTVVLPSIINGQPMQHIQSGAFEGSSVEHVIISDGYDCIGSRTFANCSNLKSVTIPDSVSFFNSSSFDGCSADLVIICSDGSAAHQYYSGKFTIQFLV